MPGFIWENMPICFTMDMLARKGPSLPDKQKRFTGVAVSFELLYRNCSFVFVSADWSPRYKQLEKGFEHRRRSGAVTKTGNGSVKIARDA